MPLLADLLRAFHQVLPGALGVVLASPEGVALASEVPGADDLARRAAASRAGGESALVPAEGGLVLVVFLPPTTLLSVTAAVPA